MKPITSNSSNKDSQYTTLKDLHDMALNDENWELIYMVTDRDGNYCISCLDSKEGTIKAESIGDEHTYTLIKREAS